MIRRSGLDAEFVLITRFLGVSVLFPGWESQNTITKRKISTSGLKLSGSESQFGLGIHVTHTMQG